MAVRFDDTLETVLATAATGPAGAQAAWRQMVDLIAHGRLPADDAAIATLVGLRDRVSRATRVASARALADARPPAVLVAFLVRDDAAVATQLLRGVILAAGEWRAILPTLTPAGRAVLRHRRDLDPDTQRALESFGATDFVIPAAADTQAPGEVDGVAAPAVVPPAPATPTPAHSPPVFVTIGDVARDIVDRARQREERDEPSSPAARPDGTFRISDVVARIEAYRQRRSEYSGHAAAVASPVARGFRFETDEAGVIRRVEGIERGALVGATIGRLARPGDAGVDGAVAGAFRQRTRFAAGRLLVAGTGEAAGEWTITGLPQFDRASGRFTGYRATARRPRADERARLATPAADALRQLVHELRTPTNAIAGFSEMIEREILGPVSEPYRDHAGAIRNDAGSLLAAIDDLDTAARLDSGALVLRREAVALAPIVERIRIELAALANARGAVLEVSAGDLAAEGDALAIERMLGRLAAAMLAAAGPGETIRLRARPDDAVTLRVAIDRPAALAQYPGASVLDVNDEDSAASLLGLGFTLRLVRNLAVEQGGWLTIGERRLTLGLPAAVDRPMEQVRQG